MNSVYIYYSDISLYYYVDKEIYGFRTISKDSFYGRLHILKCELLINFGREIVVCPLETAYQYDHMKAIIICNEEIIRKFKK